MDWLPQAPELVDFSGRAPLFPLPNVVLFPQTLLPLHVFEPRYRVLLADALAGDRLIAMALLRPGWEQLSPPQIPPIFPMVGLGVIVTHEPLADGRSNLVLRGLCRARVDEEVASDRPYRTALMQLCADQISAATGLDREQRKRELVGRFCDLFPQSNIRQTLEQSLGPSIDLGTVCDILASALPIPPLEAQPLLEELDVDRRSILLLNAISGLRGRMVRPHEVDFPPPFSPN